MQLALTNKLYQTVANTLKMTVEMSSLTFKLLDLTEFFDISTVDFYSMLYHLRVVHGIHFS